MAGAMSPGSPPTKFKSILVVTMERQITPARLFGVLVVRRLLDIWMGLLRYRAGKWVNPMACGLPAALSSRRKFLSKNYEVQEGLLQFFAPFHHLCGPECSCCLPTETIPYSPVDSVLYGIYPDSVHYSSIALCDLLTAFLRESASPVRRYFKQYILGKTDDPQGEEEFQEPGLPCPALTAERVWPALGKAAGILRTIYLRAISKRNGLAGTLALCLAQWQIYAAAHLFFTEGGG